MFACRELESRAHNYLLERFEYVSKTDEFLQLGVEEIDAFLRMDDIIVKSEETIFECILRWIEWTGNNSNNKDDDNNASASSSTERRAQHFDRLVTRVRFPLLTDHYVEQAVLTHALVRQSARCQALIKEAQATRQRRMKGGGGASAEGTQYRGSNQLLLLQCSNTSPWLKTSPVLFDFKKSSWSTLSGGGGGCRYREDSTFVCHTNGGGTVLAIGGEYTSDESGPPPPHHRVPHQGAAAAAAGTVQVLLGKKGIGYFLVRLPLFR
jgi:hypothetical protein